jgi:hypothetical protein
MGSFYKSSYLRSKSLLCQTLTSYSGDSYLGKLPNASDNCLSLLQIDSQNNSYAPVIIPTPK